MVTPHLAKHHDVAISVFYGLEGAPLVWNGIRCLPGCGQDFGNVFLPQHAKEHFGEVRDGLVVTLLDVWVLDTNMVKGLNAASWVPVDHEPCLPGVVRYFKESGAVPIAMSEFGKQQLEDVGLDPLYCPHAVDTQVLKPYPKADVRKEVGIPEDAFLIGMVAANKGRPSRKGFQQAMEAFRIFHSKHKEAILYLHTTASPQIAAGEDILAIARALGIQDQVVVAPSYRMMYDPLPAESMAQVYSALDVLINCSMGEGFGIPILEAASCGVPAVVTNFSAMPQVAGPAGLPVACRPYWTPGNSWQAVPDVQEMVEALELAYSESAEDKAKRSRVARNHALDYDVKKVVKDRMLPALEMAWERFGDREPEVIRSRLATA